MKVDRVVRHSDGTYTIVFLSRESVEITCKNPLSMIQWMLAPHLHSYDDYTSAVDSSMEVTQIINVKDAV